MPDGLLLPIRVLVEGSGSDSLKVLPALSGDRIQVAYLNLSLDEIFLVGLSGSKGI